MAAQIPALDRLKNEFSDEPLRYPEIEATPIRRQLYQGNWETAQGIGCTPMVLQRVLYQLRRYGYVFERELREDGSIAYRLTNRDHEPALVARSGAPKPRSPRKIGPLLAAFKKGQSFTRGEAMTQFEISADAFRRTILRLRNEGYEVSLEDHTYSATKRSRAARVADEVDGTATEVEPASTDLVTPNVPAPPVTPNAPAPPALNTPVAPALGEMLEVCIVALSNEASGGITVGLRSPTHVWFCSLKESAQR